MRKLFASLIILTTGILHAQTTAFTYQGRLNNNGNAASGTYDLVFALYNDASLGSQQGAALTNSSVAVANGLFTTTLDFGSTQLNGQPLWLQILVRTNGNGAFTPLTPRQSLSSVPYAVQAVTAANANSVAATNISGTIQNTSLPTSANFSGAISANSFSGNGAALVGVNASTLGGMSANNFWQLGGNNVGFGQFIGSTNNQPVEFWANGLRALRLEPAANGAGVTNVVNVIGGSSANYVTTGVRGATIAGGGQLGGSNVITFDGGAIGGGFHNSVSNFNGVVSGGVNNAAGGNASSVAGGSENIANGDHAGIGGGQGNTAAGAGAFISGGVGNSSSADLSFVGGGYQNLIQPGTAGVIGGGYQNTVRSNAYEGTIAGGWANVIGTNAYQAAIGGGSQNIATGDHSAIASGLGNTNTGVRAFIGGGLYNLATNVNSVVGGGAFNTAGGNAAAVGGGSENVATGDHAVISGGQGNFADGDHAVIAGGFDNTNSGYRSFIGGGEDNNIPYLSDRSAIVSGGNNLIVGSYNYLLYDFIGAGQSNAMLTNAIYSFIGSGFSNVIQTNGQYASIPGGSFNVAGASNSFAAGYRAQALHNGSFVWADLQNADFASTTTNEFSIRAQNGVRIQTDKGIHLNAADEPLIVRDWDVFATNAPVSKVGIGRWGLFMEPTVLTIGIPDTNGLADSLTRYFQVAKYNTNGTSSPLIYVDQSGNLTVSGSISGNGNNLTHINASQITSGTLSLAQLPTAVVTNGASGVNISGTFSGNGAGVTNVNLGYVNSEGVISWPGDFALSSSFKPVLPNPTAVMTADINGDGKADIIIATDSGILSVYTNNGSGSFAGSSYSVGSNPAFITTADVNGDGRVDIITANHGNNTLSVLTNIGNAHFQLAATLTVGTNPQGVAAADINGDGKMDLISANFGNNTLSVLTNNGNGGFVLSSTLAVGTNPQGVTAGDINGDGKMDLISANYGSSTLSVLTNNGSGGFILASTLAVGSAPYNVLAIDVNADSKIDLASANYGGSVSVLTNNGTGGFVSASSPSVGAGADSLAAADVNGDGKIDLITANSANNTASVLTNNGKGVFIVASTPAVGNYPMSVAAADFNGDGKADLVVANYLDNSVSLLLNTPTFDGYFAGDGSGLTSLNASQLTSGTIPLAQLPSTVVVNNETNLILGGTFNGNGVGLTNVMLTNVNGALPVNTPWSVTGNRTNGWQNAMVSLENTNTTTNVAPALRVLVDGGTTPDGALSVSVNSTSGLLAEFGNSGSFVVKITNNGSIYATAFNQTSDRSAKEHFKTIDSETILEKVAALPITEWNYKADKDSQHIGPMAQDFYATFGTGTDDKHIATVDESGVALAAIQGLNQKLQQEVKTKDEQIEELKKRLDALERLVTQASKQQ